MLRSTKSTTFKIPCRASYQDHKLNGANRVPASQFRSSAFASSPILD